jgi:hypothetical protein
LLTYDHPANIYFDLTNEQRDSIVYTFAYDLTKAQDTVYLPVRIMGYRADSERNYQAYIEQDSSTANPDVHYKVLEKQYPIEGKTGGALLPLIIYNVPDIAERAVSIIVKLRGNEDFGLESPNIARAKVILSAQLEKPNWWDIWPLQPYSRTKHQLFFIVTEQRSLTTPSTDPFGSPKNLYFTGLLSAMLNDPFKWVSEHPEKGYVLTSKDNGATYSFYNLNNPSINIVLKRNDASGRYFFIDEEGKEIH